MLEVVMRYAHGFVAVPVIAACRDGGVFAALSADGPQDLASLSARLGANDGPLAASLRLLVSLGWLDCDGAGHYRPTDRAALADAVPDGILELLRVDGRRHLDGTLPSPILTRFLAAASAGWAVGDPLLASFLDGMVVVPLLVALQELGALDVVREGRWRLDRLSDSARGELATLVRAKGWGEAGALTAEGKFVSERALLLSLPYSYAPLLAGLPQLLRGDAESLFEATPDGSESHVDRARNVESSGFQHRRFFADLDQALIGLFDSEPVQAQPRYVCDMGCGDGTLLEHIYETVRTRSRRGRVLADFPLTMIGVDANAAALEATARRLGGAGIPHLVLVGDIAEPEQLLRDLAARGADDADAILHVRSFLDHDRPVRAARDPEAARRRAGAVPDSLIALDRSGRRIAPESALQSLVEHLTRWTAALGRHGLLLLEVHSLPPETVQRHLDASENLYFDALHAFSGQHLVPAPTFRLALAEAGLFVGGGRAWRYPQHRPFTRITAGWYEKRSYRIRHPNRADLKRLAALDALAWEPALRTDPEVLEARLAGTPGWHLVLEQDGVVVSALYGQRIESVAALDGATVVAIDRLAVPGGPVVQLLGLSTDPACQDHGFGDALLSFALDWWRLSGEVTAIVGVTRCRDRERHPDLSMDGYIARRGADGLALDPILRFHQLHGARIVGLVPGYRPSDLANDGAGILIRYPGAAPTEQLDPARTAGAAGSLRDLVHEAIRRSLGPARAGHFATDATLRDMGLDSLDLMDLRHVLGERLETVIDGAFFFRHATPAAIVAALSGNAKSAPRSAARPVPVPAEPLAQSARMPVAVIGMACRFPGAADTPEKLWSLLIAGIDAIGPVPAGRWDAEALAAPEPGTPGRINGREGGFVADIDQFDAGFFALSRREAALLDPQHRLLLEVSWEALERAGIDPLSLAGSRTGVFVGLGPDDYRSLQVKNARLQSWGLQSLTGTAASVGVGRLAYFYDLKGPAIALDTACSSGLTAVHFACDSLRSGACTLALAAAAQLNLTPEPAIAYSQVHMLAPDSRCKTFDAAADGYGRSEGVGLVVLKPLALALAEGDPVLAVIRGTAINHDGRSNGLTAPSAGAQVALLREALAAAEAEPDQVGYIETNGTGTRLGDAVEVAALADVFGGRNQPLVLGAIKTSIGHTETAAGMAGLIKAVQVLQTGLVPPNLHLSRPNPDLALGPLHALLPATPVALPAAARLAGVSAFGMGGSNAHVVLGEAPPVAAAAAPDQVELYPLSAATPAALGQLAARHAEALAPEGPRLADASYTAGLGRAALPHRLAIVAGSSAEAARALAGFAAGDGTGVRRGEAGEPPQLAWLFTGQGSQHAGMGSGFYETVPVFRRVTEEADALLRADLPLSLIDVLYGAAGRSIDQTLYTQPALYAVEVALAALWRAAGIVPAAVLGHSVGQYAAAQSAGVFSFADGLRLIAARARLMQELPAGGRMIALRAAPESVAAALQPFADRAAIAAVNGPASTVVSGAADAVDAVAEALGPEAKPVRLAVSHAFHSPLMDPMLPEFAEIAATIALAPPLLPLISNRAGEIAGDEVATPAYWVRHVREPVAFAPSIATLSRLGIGAAAELGPRPILLGLARGCGFDGVGLASLDPAGDDRKTLATSLAELWVRGSAVRFPALHDPALRRKVVLPTYPFQRARHWLPSRAGSDG